MILLRDIFNVRVILIANNTGWYKYELSYMYLHLCNCNHFYDANSLGASIAHSCKLYCKCGHKNKTCAKRTVNRRIRQQVRSVEPYWRQITAHRSYFYCVRNCERGIASNYKQINQSHRDFVLFTQSRHMSKKIWFRSSRYFDISIFQLLTVIYFFLFIII